MGYKSAGKILIASLLVVIAFSPLLKDMGVEAEETRAPDYFGHITADATWSGIKWFDDITIDPGVTVTVESGTTLNHYAGSYFWVHGTLIVDGTESDPVVFGESGSPNTWDGIRVNETGRAFIENITMNKVLNHNILLEAHPSEVRNGVFHGGNSAIWASTSQGGHTLEHLTCYSQDSWAVAVLNNNDPARLYDIEIVNSGIGGVGIQDSSNISAEKVKVKDTKSQGILVSSFMSDDMNNIMIDDFEITGDDPSSAIGMQVVTPGKPMRNIIISNGMIDDCQSGIQLNTYSPSYTIFDHITLGSGVNLSIMNSNTDYNGRSLFRDCTINGNYRYYLNSTGDLDVELLNCSWDRYGKTFLDGEAEVNVSWFMDLTIVDGNSAPLGTNVKVFQHGHGIIRNVDYPGGIANSIYLRGNNYNSTDSSKFNYDFTFTSLDPSETVMEKKGHYFPSYTRWNIMMDLWPDNTFPAEIEFDEDDKTELNLYDYFTDPEEGDFTWDLMTGPDLKHQLIQSHEVLRLEPAEDNWYGNSWVRINATDEGGNWTEANATVKVLPINDLPYLVDPLPELTTPEDTPVWINFTGRAIDMDEDELTWHAETVDNCSLSLDETWWNLTITPDDNWFGILEIPVSVSDSLEEPKWVLIVNVTPVNDLPLVEVMWSNGTEVDQVEYAWNETVNITVWEITTMEDMPVEFGFFYDDVETSEPDNILIYSDLMHGALDLTVYQREEIINATTNETGLVDYTMMTNYTYTPDGNDFAGDLIQFNISDGEMEKTLWIWFNVESVNDRPAFEAPDEWNVTVDLDNLTVVDVGGWMSDVDGDDLTITADPDDFITINGTLLEILYNETFMEDHQNVTVTISDGVLTAGAVIRINVNQPVPGDDDDDQFTVVNPEVESDKDSWTVTVEGEPGQDVYLAVEDDDGTVTYHKMDYEDGKYTATIDNDDAEDGFDYYFTDEDGGDSMVNGGTLPKLEEKDEPFPWWIVAVVLAILLIGIIALVILGKGTRSGDFDEE